MVTSILSIIFLIIICVIFYDIATVKNCGNCKHEKACWAKIDMEGYKHCCDFYEKADEKI